MVAFFLVFLVVSFAFHVVGAFLAVFLGTALGVWCDCLSASAAIMFHGSMFFVLFWGSIFGCAVDRAVLLYVAVPFLVVGLRIFSHPPGFQAAAGLACLALSILHGAAFQAYPFELELGECISQLSVFLTPHLLRCKKHFSQKSILHPKRHRGLMVVLGVLLACLVVGGLCI